MKSLIVTFLISVLSFLPVFPYKDRIIQTLAPSPSPEIQQKIVSQPESTPGPSASVLPISSLPPAVSPPPVPQETAPASTTANDYSQIKALVGLIDAIPQKPPIPASGFINGVSPDFPKIATPELLYLLQKAEVETLVFKCQTPDPNNWHVVGSFNVQTWAKYGIDNSHGYTSDWVNLVKQNPGGVYESQRADLKKVEGYYCKDGRKVLLF
ncbi:hypothetical protein A2160_01275 [Candidatus Beckwithbacteria bacterium RBG_13_42_9]|uniref:Uncharacterized protein n=1 Tax=Candidatus Beckwithbacteria bacterium RBG_13_42_9 TaxID=1797457 RepID=A0A1F5E430_9BACT|nr:MAG: hypothetical protein A2160_01275 [Candidatus Beckwithbacteria bacterium RBG_13_42_9]